MERNNNQQDAQLLTVSEVAEILRVDNTTVRRWIAQGILAAVILPRVGPRYAYRVKRETMEKILQGGVQ